MLKHRALRASLWTVTGNSGQQIVAFLVFVYLARVLTPAEFGLMALAAALVDLMTVFGRFGQVEALLQRGRMSRVACSTSFWLLLAIGIAILLVLATMAQPFAKLFGEPQVATLLLVLAPVPLLQNLGQVHEAQLRRRFDYRGLAVRNTGATLISGAASIAVAAAGYGVYALVAQKLVFAAAYSILVMIAFRWRPNLLFSGSDARRLLRVGFDVVVANLINILNPRILDIAVGYYLGVVALGYLRIAWRLFDLAQQLVIQPVSLVAITSLTAHGGDPTAVGRSFLQYLRMLSLVAIPAFVGVGLLADDAIRLAAGPQWAESAPLLALLSLSAAAMPLNFLFPPAMIGAGRTLTIRRLALAQTVVTAGSVLVAVHYGLVAVMLAHVARVYLFAGINSVHLRRTLGIGWADVLRVLAPPVCAATVMAGAVAAIQRFVLPEADPLITIAALGTAGLVVYLATILAGGVVHIWRDYPRDIIHLLRPTRDEPTEVLAVK